MSLRDLMSADETETETIPTSDPEPESNTEPEPEEDVEPEEAPFVTSADIDHRLLFRSVRVDTAEELFRATSAEGFDVLIQNLRAEERPYQIVNRFTGKVYDSFLDFVPDESQE